MQVRHPQYDSKEYARRGDEAYEHRVKPTLRPDGYDRFAVIDIESGDFELDFDKMAASDRLLARHPDAQIWIVGVGHRAAYRIGFACVTRTHGA